MLDANSAVMTAELEKDNSAVATVELLTTDNEIDIFHTMQVANVAEFPIGIVLCQTANHSYVQYAVRDYTKPMGVATYKTLDDMPEKLRKALPDIKKMMEILEKKNNF